MNREIAGTAIIFLKGYKVIPTRQFGNTGHESSSVIFGAAALWNETQYDSDKLLEILINYGVNHIDVAPRYGEAEVRVGVWMKEHRKRFFLATKTDNRTYQGAKEDFFRSLDRLQTDYVDLIQLHSLTNPDDWQTCFGPKGALEALIEFKNQGLAKFIGVTGHGWIAPAMHRWSLEKFNFDSILMPWSWHASNFRNYKEEFNKTAKICEKRKIAIQTIKGIARGPWAAGVKPNRSTWYQPFEDENVIKNCIHWILNRKNIFLNSVGDINLVPLVLKAAQNFETCPSEATMQNIDQSIGTASIFGI